MINTDRVSLECDLAETYHIFDMYRLPALKVAFFSCGLRENSRIMMKLSNRKIDTNTMLLMGIIDKLNILAWQNTDDGHKGRNYPKSVLKEALGDYDKDSNIGFASGEDFEIARRKILEKGE